MLRRRNSAHAVLTACAVVFLLAACARDAEPPPSNPRISFHADPARAGAGVISIAPIDPKALKRLERSKPSQTEWESILALFVGADPAPGTSAVLGTHSIAGDTLRFTPRFPPVAGQSYFARFDAGALRARIGERGIPNVSVSHRWLGTAAATNGSTEVLAVYPSAERVPMNLLRLYVHFSAPMRMGEAEQRITVLDDQGKVVEDAFLRVPQELWDPDKQRLTVLFDPGRIKRDLRPHEELGLPLQEGRTYTLRISKEWQDAQGRPLARDFEKRSRVGAADRTSPRPADWTIIAPARATRAPLRVDFNEPLDHALLQRVLVVKRQGQLVAGKIEVSDEEKRWSFVPAQDWSADNYVIEVGTELEDLAGNNLLRIFDREKPTAGSTNTPSFVSLPFVVR